MKKRMVVIILMLMFGFMASSLLLAHNASAVTLQQAIAKAPHGAASGQINPKAAPGYLGIPGAPHINVVLGLIWAIWVGWIFSSVGAFGGIMAGVGHMTVFGLGDYAKTFKKTSPVFNKLITDSIRVSNQWLVGLSGAISSTNYWRMGRLVAPLGIALAIGSVGGSLLIPILTAGKIKLSAYMGYFGLVVFVIGGFLLYETTPRGQNRKKEAKAAAMAFEKSIKENKSADEIAAMGVKITNLGLTNVGFTFFGVEFKFNPILAAFGGLFIAALASFLGIGGGFLFVPFLTSVVGLPMYLVAGTSALTVFIGMVVSIFSYMILKGTVVQWSLIGMELIGIFIGSMLGPRTSKYIPDIWLKRLFIVLALYVGLRYVSKGFFGVSWVPPY